MTDEAERLYGLPLGEFTSARDTLVRALKQEGRADEAREVAALRKPVVSAWIVNRLVRDERDEVRRLVQAADAIRKGEDGADARFRASLERLTAAARAMLEAEGRSPDDALQQVAETLRAGAASSPDVLLGGMLTRPLESSGFGAMEGADVGRAGRRRAGGAKAKAPDRVDRRRLERARRDAAEARAEAKRLEAEAREAERAARSARTRADAARRKAEEAEARLAAAKGG